MLFVVYSVCDLFEKLDLMDWKLDVLLILNMVEMYMFTEVFWLSEVSASSYLWELFDCLQL